MKKAQSLHGPKAGDIYDVDLKSGVWSFLKSATMI